MTGVCVVRTVHMFTTSTSFWVDHYGLRLKYYMKANMSVRQLITIVMYVGTVVRVDTSKYVIDDSDGLGRRFDGIGGISGGGVSYSLFRFHIHVSKYRNTIFR